MASILLVTSSLFGEGSQSSLVAGELAASLRQADPRLTLVQRDLDGAIPHLDLATMAAGATPAERRTPAQQAEAALADRLIEELEAAEVVVLAAPMYNFSIPSTLKAWLDHIVRAGRTFRYGAAGPEGLLKDKRVYVVTGRGGIYSEGPARAMDFQEPYLRAVLGFVGLREITFVHAEGLQMGEEARAQGLAKARSAFWSEASRAAA
jgi:FMN-dependent NADH-azoreductase